jgi:hypothetical protein
MPHAPVGAKEGIKKQMPVGGLSFIYLVSLRDVNIILQSTNMHMSSLMLLLYQKKNINFKNL